MNRNRQNRGITLVALVITIIVLLILAGVSINMLTGNNGIISRAGEAKNETEKSEEKEKVSMAVTSTRITDNGYGKLNQNSLQSEINNQFGNGKATVTDNEDGTFTVTMNNDKGRSYTIENGGEITEGIYDKWDGTSEAEPTQMTSTEIHISKASELKWLANQVNNNDKTFEGYTIYLENNLDLGAREDNGNWETSENEAVKWTPIGKNSGNNFKATFNGNNHIIRNTYISENTYYTGLFGNGYKIQNLILKNSYVKGSFATGGIAGTIQSGGNIENCHNINSSVILGYEYFSLGGIVGQSMGNIINCNNTGTITAIAKYSTGQSGVGGIVGAQYGEILKNCHNSGEINSIGSTAGGIAGIVGNSTTIPLAYIVSDCYNTGNVIASDHVGGVVGSAANIVTKCYNTGNVTGGGTGGTGGIVGGSVGNTTKAFSQSISLCYNSGIVTSLDGVGGISGNLGAQGYAGTETQCYNKGKVITTGTSTQVGGIIGYMANDANATRNFYLSSIGVEKGVGAIKSGGDIVLQNQGAKATEVDLKTFEEFMTWIEQQ